MKCFFYLAVTPFVPFLIVVCHRVGCDNSQTQVRMIGMQRINVRLNAKHLYILYKTLATSGQYSS
jgi:hypothetical protein